ncbi:MAG: corrinoid protein [Lachnospiraceae bacterium]|nr:corrinoid protein [Lachnospiraceae bacterium]
MTFEELCTQAKEAMVDLDEDLAYETLDTAIEDGADLTALLTNGYSAGMQELGDLFAEKEVFLPDLMYASEIMENVSAKIEESMDSDGSVSNSKGTIVFATVEGDVHDIGKGICCSLLKAEGFTVYDMGKDVSAEAIVNKAEEVHADLIGLSALLTTTMMVQRDVIEMLKEKGIRDQYKVLVGGAPVTPAWADQIGADGYSGDAAACVKLASSLM